jgi:hypothetical protein
MKILSKSTKSTRGYVPVIQIYTTVTKNKQKIFQTDEELNQSPKNHTSTVLQTSFCQGELIKGPLRYQ